MKFAFVDGTRREAEPGLSGCCSLHGHAMVAKCGEIRSWHWAHQGNRSCDPWWENETEWHRNWKAHFPEDWQEAIHHAENGERHIADVKTSRGWIIEFQHSYINPDERRSREAFYKKLVWIVDGSRRKRDVAQFTSAWNAGAPIGPIRMIPKVFSEECRLLREWAVSMPPVFLDFGEGPIWWLLNKGLDKPTYVAPYSRTEFIGIHRGEAFQAATEFDNFVKNIEGLVAQYEQFQARSTSRQRFRDPLAQIDSRQRRF